MKNIYLILLVLVISFTKLVGQNNAQFISQTVPATVGLNEVFNVSITFKNTGATTWTTNGLYRMGSEAPRDNGTWGAGRIELPNDVSPGEEVTFSTSLTAPSSGDGYGTPFQWRMVQDGVEWFGEYSEVLSIFVGTGALDDSLLMPEPSFSILNNIVSTSMFHWYGPTTGQVSGPWIPIEGRENWTGEVPFWKKMIKQSMAANIDVFYILVIPTMEQARVNLFRALNELRREGWDVPKVCPFFDPIITYTILGTNGNASTAVGKDEIVNHYIRFYKQYYSVNFDSYADDYIYTQDDIPVLDTWHVHLNIDNYSLLTRTDVSSRLSAEFGAEHPIFNNGIKMITTAISPTFTFADEKVHQFEVHEYHIEKNKNGIVSAQLKPGYWDQNVRNPGTLLKRDGGSQYTNAWSQLSASVSRVYIESFNEYDEGSGIYAAKTDVIFRTDLNPTNTDTWSSSNDPYEYIKTTATGAANFNDNAPLDAKIIWHDIPDEMYPGDTYNATIVMRNEGNTQWNNTNDFKFGQQDSDPVFFGLNRYFIDDSQDEIPEYGGIFRGRTITFNLQIVAPEVEGDYTNHYQMIQENIAWFGEVLTKSITVSLDASLGVEDFDSQNQFNLYPNPVKLGDVIQINGDFKKNDRIILLNILGSKIIEQKIQNDKQNISLSLQNGNIIGGIYIIQVISGTNIQTKKLIIQD